MRLFWLFVALFAAPAYAADVSIGTITGPIKEDLAQAITRALQAEELEVADGAPVVIDAVVSKQGNKWAVDLTVKRDGNSVKQWTVRSPKILRLAPLVEKELWGKLGGVIGQPSPTVGVAGPKPKVVLFQVEGNATEEAEEAVVEALEGIAELWEFEDAELRARELATDLESDDGKRSVAAEAGVSAWVILSLQRSGKNLLASARVLDGSGREVAGVPAAGKTPETLGAALAKDLAPVLSGLRPPKRESTARVAPKVTPKKDVPKATKIEAPPAAPAEAKAEAKADAKAPTPQDDRALNQSTLEVAAGLGFFTRSLRYTDDLFGELRPYDLGSAPVLRLDATFYPLGFLGRGALSHIGLEAHGTLGLGIKSADSAGNEYSTSALQAEVGLRGRLPIATHQLGLAVGFGLETFSLSGGGGPDFPNVGYSFLRVGLDGRFVVYGPLAICFRGGYRIVTSAGDIQGDDWFPRSSVGAVDGSLGVRVAMLGGLGLNVGADFRRFFYTMNPEPGDPRIAGGAVDQYMAGTLTLDWLL